MSESKRSPQSSGSASGGGGSGNAGVNGTDNDSTSDAASSKYSSEKSPVKQEPYIKTEPGVSTYHTPNQHNNRDHNNHLQLLQAGPQHQGKEAQKPHSSGGSGGKGAKRSRENRDKAAAAAAAAAAEKEEHRREAANRKMFIEDFWDCSICTFRNKAEAFKCGVCDARKGTSTRKPRINPAQLVVAQQVAQQPKPKRKREQSNKKFKNMDRNSDIQTSITVNGLTVVITEFKPKASSRKRTVSENSNGSSDGGGTVQQSDEEFESLPSNTLAEKSSP